MKWMKHDTDANSDAKLKKLRMKYGLEGYGLYWYCLELVAANVDKDNLTFELEHDAEIISFDTGIHYERIQEMMTYMVSLSLFEQDNGILTCLKLAKRLDKSMTNSPAMRRMIGNIKERHDTVSECHDRLDKNRLDKNNTSIVMSEIEQADLNFAEHMFETIVRDSPNFKKPDFKKWANTLRLMRERDNRNPDDIASVWRWVRNDPFWNTNILSADKLRKQFDQLLIKSKGDGNGQGKSGGGKPARQTESTNW